MNTYQELVGKILDAHQADKSLNRSDCYERRCGECSLCKLRAVLDEADKVAPNLFGEAERKSVEQAERKSVEQAERIEALEAELVEKQDTLRHGGQANLRIFNLAVERDHQLDQALADFRKLRLHFQGLIECVERPGNLMGNADFRAGVCREARKCLQEHGNADEVAKLRGEHADLIDELAEVKQELRDWKNSYPNYLTALSDRDKAQVQVEAFRTALEKIKDYAVECGPDDAAAFEMMARDALAEPEKEG